MVELGGRGREWKGGHQEGSRETRECKQGTCNYGYCEPQLL